MNVSYSLLTLIDGMADCGMVFHDRCGKGLVKKMSPCDAHSKACVDQVLLLRSLKMTNPGKLTAR